ACTWKHTGEAELIDVAQSAMLYSCSRQHDDGSWWYAEDPKYHWIDSFHTGYNIDSLKRYIECTGDSSYEQHLLRGLRYFRDVFFEVNGRPRYYHNSTYPVDIQCAAQAIETLAHCTDRDASCLERSQKVAEWTIEN